ncbi:MAG: hypothetical protein U1F66_03850 [bacterium]
MVSPNTLHSKTIPDLSLRFAAASYEKKDGTDEAEVLQILEELQSRGEGDKEEFEQTLIAMAKTNGKSGKNYFEKLSRGMPEKGFVARILADEMKGLWIQSEYKHAMALWDPTNTLFREVPGDFESMAEGLLNSVAQLGESCLEHPILSGALLSLGIGAFLATGGKVAAVGAGAKLLQGLPRVLKSLELLGNLAGTALAGMGAGEMIGAAGQKDPLARSSAFRQAGEHLGEALLSFSVGGGTKAAPKNPAAEFQTLLRNLGRGAPKEDLQALAVLIRPDPRHLPLEDHRAIAKALDHLEPSDLLSLDREALWNFLMRNSKRVPAEISASLEIKLLPHAQGMDKAGLGATLFIYLSHLDPKGQAEVTDAIFSNLKNLNPEDEKRGLLLLCNLIQGTPTITGQRIRWENFSTHLEKIFTDPARDPSYYAKLLLHVAERTPRGRRNSLQNLWRPPQAAKWDRKLNYLIEWDQKSPEEMLAVFVQKSRGPRQDGLPHIQESAFWEAMEQAIQEGALDKLAPLSSENTAQLIDHLMDQPMLAIANGSFPEIQYRQAMTALFEKLDPSAQESLYGAAELLRLLHPHNGSTMRLHQELGGLLSLKNSGLGTIEAVGEDVVRIRQVHPGNIKEKRLWAELPDSVRFLSYEAHNGVDAKQGLMARFWDPTWSDTEGPLMISVHMTRDQACNLKPQTVTVDIGYYDSRGRLLDFETLGVPDIPAGAEGKMLRTLVEEYQQRLQDMPIGAIDVGGLMAWLERQFQTRNLENLSMKQVNLK